MNNLENFHVNEGADNIDSGAFERLREKMAQARAQIKRDKKQEASQVKKDDILFNVLIEFIKHFPSDHPLVKGIVSCLSSNVPSLVILSVISLNYSSIAKAIPVPEDAKEIQIAQIPDINKLVNWLKKVNYSLSDIKASDIPKVYPKGELSPSLRGLIVHTLSEFFKTIPEEELSVEKVEGYTQSILTQIHKPDLTQKTDELTD